MLISTHLDRKPKGNGKVSGNGPTRPTQTHTSP